jgi:hypothetical protein
VVDETLSGQAPPDREAGEARIPLSAGELARPSATAAELKAIFELLPDIEYDRAGSGVFDHRQGAAAEVTCVQIGEISTGLRTVFVDRAAVVGT